MAILPPDPVFCLKSDMDFIHSICFPSQEACSSIFAATEKGYIYLWNLETNRLATKQQLGESIQVVHSFDDVLITQEKLGCVKLWQLKSQSNYELLNKFDCAEGFCRSLLLNDKLIIAQDNKTVDVININTLEKIKTFTPSDRNYGQAMCLQKVEIGDNTYILEGFETGDIILWDLNTGKDCGHLQLRDCITSLTFDPVTGRGICGNASNVLQVFTIDKSFKITLKCEISLANPGCSVVKLRPDRKIFVCGGWDGRLSVFSWKSLRPLAVLTEHGKTVSDVQFSPGIVKLWNSNIMASCAGDGVIALWDLYN